MKQSLSVKPTLISGIDSQIDFADAGRLNLSTAAQDANRMSEFYARNRQRFTSLVSPFTMSLVPISHTTFFSH